MECAKIFEQEEVFVFDWSAQGYIGGKYPVCENMNYSGTRIQSAGHLVDAYQRTAIDWKALATQWGAAGGLEAIA